MGHPLPGAACAFAIPAIVTVIANPNSNADIKIIKGDRYTLFCNRSIDITIWITGARRNNNNSVCSNC